MEGRHLAARDGHPGADRIELGVVGAEVLACELFDGQVGWFADPLELGRPEGNESDLKAGIFDVSVQAHLGDRVGGGPDCF